MTDLTTDDEYVITRKRAFCFELDDEDSQVQVIKDAKKYGLAIMKPITNEESECE